MIKLRSAALGVAGVFLWAAVIAAVLALALWDFKSHDTEKNVLYGVGVLLSFIMNFLIAGSLVQGIRFNMPQLMLPYIVCASFHLLISMASILFFMVSALDELWSEEFTQVQSLYILAFFIVASFAWVASLIIVRQQRIAAQKANGQYCIFNSLDI